MGVVNANYLSNWKNVSGTKDRSCSCGTWLNHWFLYSGSQNKANKCSVLGCNSIAEVGGHVRQGNGTKEYIVPLCKGCNNSTQSFTLKLGTRVAPANKSETCG